MKSSRSRGRGRRSSQARVAVPVVIFFLILAAAALPVWQRRNSLHPAAQAEVYQPAAETSFGVFPAPSVQMQNRRPVYPYSVVPGGVVSGDELRDAAAHDPIVAEHYAGFDFKRAHVVEVSQPQLVYLSYRRREKIFWTSKKAALHKGEKLITDGQITARTRCGNQISVLPQARTSPEEPSMEELDRPEGAASGMQQFVPSSFDSELLNLDPGLPFGPSPLSGGRGIGPFPGGFMPMPIAAGPGTTGTSPTQTGCQTNCNPPPPPIPPPPTIPEPGTIVLVSSGAIAVGARLCRSRR